MVEQLIATCPDWSIHDFILCFKNGKRGKYPIEYYNNVNGLKIFELVMSYEQERSIARENEVNSDTRRSA